jgi:hypothetical protein
MFKGIGESSASSIAASITGGTVEKVEPVWLLRDGNFSTGPALKSCYVVTTNVESDNKPVIYLDAQTGNIVGGWNRVNFDYATAHVTGGVPGIPNLAGEVIVVDPYAYVRAPGAITYTSEGDSNLPINPASASGPLYLIQQVVAVANDKGLSPVLVGVEQEQYGSSYHIRVDVSQSALNSKLSSLQAVQALGSGQLDLWITQSGFQLERLEYRTSDPSSGAAAIRLVLSNWNNVSPILAPPANQMDLGLPSASN